MSLPAGTSQAEIAAILRRMGWVPVGFNQASNKIKVGVGDAQSLHVAGWPRSEGKPWPDSERTPRWWRAISMKDYQVVALGTSDCKGYVWLYNAKECKLAMWYYYSRDS